MFSYAVVLLSGPSFAPFMAYGKDDSAASVVNADKVSLLVLPRYEVETQSSKAAS